MLGRTGMLNIGGAFFLQVPYESTERIHQIPDESAERILHAAKVVDLTGNILTARFEDRNLDIAKCPDIVEGRDLFIFYEVQGDFLQQPAYVRKILYGELKPTFELETTGEPASAESRQHHRVSTVGSGLAAELAGEDQCPLLDVSCTGFSVISSRNYAIGSIVEATLIHQGEEYRGKVSVQSIRELSKGRIRYGLLCVEHRASTGNMLQGLQDMTVSLQSGQLRRLAATT